MTLENETPDPMDFLECDYQESPPEGKFSKRLGRAWAAEKHFTMLAERAKAEKNELIPKVREELIDGGYTAGTKLHVHGFVGLSATPKTKYLASPLKDAVLTGDYARAMEAAGLGFLVQHTTHPSKLASWYEEQVKAGNEIPEAVKEVISTFDKETLSLRKVVVDPSN